MSSDPLMNNPPVPSDPAPLVATEALPSAGPLGGELTGLLRLRGILDRARALKNLLSLKPFDTSTAEGRSRERYRRAALTTLSAVVSRGVTIMASLITVRLTVRYLGTERYGLWMTITSVVSMLIFADMGMGNGLVNVISDAHGRDDDEAARRYMSSAFFILLAIAALLLGVFALIHPFVPWPRIFNVSSPVAVRESGPAIFVFVVCFLLNLPLDVVQRLQAGYQEGFATNSWRAVGSLLGLVNLILAMRFGYGLPILILAVVGGQLLGVVGNWIHEFGWTHRRFWPQWSYCDAAAAKKILNLGVWFFVGQASAVFMIPIDNVIITQFMGPEAVTQYSVPMRLFILITTISAMFVAPLWPAYGESLARGDMRWVRSTFYQSLVYNLIVFAPVSLIIAALGRPLVHLWVGKQIQPTYPLLLGMAMWTICAVIAGAINTCLTGINEVKFQAWVSVAMAVVNIVLKILMAKAFGLPGVVWAAVLTYSAGTAVMAAHIQKKLREVEASPRG
jgi:O-antigen/teichoic acid export membrane protein